MEKQTVFGMLGVELSVCLTCEALVPKQKVTPTTTTAIAALQQKQQQLSCFVVSKLFLRKQNKKLTLQQVGHLGAEEKGRKKDLFSKQG